MPEKGRFFSSVKNGAPRTKQGSSTQKVGKRQAVLKSSVVMPILAAIAGLFGQTAVAQNYPNGPVHLIVPYSAGGLADALARTTGTIVSGSLGVPVVVEDRPGASSIIGMDACAKAKPDGQTLCLTVADSLSYNPQLFAKLPYDPDKSFTPVIRLAWTNNLLVANAKAPFNSYKEMIAYAKANPGKVNWGTWGLATLPDLYLRWVASHAGVDITGIPYGGAGKGNLAVYSGEVDITYMGFGVASPQIKDGRIKPLVAVGNKRSPLMPELPSLGEEGGDPGLQGYFGLFAPGGTPKPIVDRLNAEFAKAIASEKVQEFYKVSTLVWESNTPEQFAAFAKADREAAAKVFKSIGVTPQAAPQ
jgi:tripartite-type tricarboxylate transporter receptor subunit TctC